MCRDPNILKLIFDGFSEKADNSSKHRQECGGFSRVRPGQRGLAKKLRIEICLLPAPLVDF